MGGFAPLAFPKKEKGNPEKEKARSKNKKDTAEKTMPAVGDTALTAWIDRPLAAFA
jgi:predicted small lipoprotein YifL